MDTLDRLYRRLLQAVQQEYPGDAEPPLSVAEVYQKLVPYRGVRDELGFGELAEYEHSLLRLLAGERDYLQVELEQVRDELRRELRSANPILGVYRDYAAVGVRLRPAAPPASVAPVPTLPAAAAAPAVLPAAPAAPPAPRAPERSVAAPVREAAPPAPLREAMAEPTAVPPAPGSATVRRDAAPRRVTCRSCNEALPQGRDVRFCPYCGTSQLPVPCRDCGTPLEPEWAFCIRCGATRRPAASR